MIKNTFIHLQGVGAKTEKNIWQKGISSWHDFLSINETVVSLKQDTLMRNQLEDSIANVENIKYFADRLPSSDSWRMFGDFKEKAAYLDIETCPDFYEGNAITVIGLYDGDNVCSFISGKNLMDFEIAVSSYDLLITYNGSGFDIPIIRNFFPNISLPPGHIDLRFLLSRLGYKGGLKKIEKEFGLMRDTRINGLCGLDAVELWRAYTWGDLNALNLLIHYNKADVINLKPLMETGYEMMKRSIMAY